MGRRKTTISENALEMIVSINQRLTDLVMLLDKNWETQLKAAEKEGEE